MKLAHVGFGLAWLAGLVALGRKRPAGWWTLLALSLCTLWYLPIGTLCSLIAGGLLLTPGLRALR